MEEPLRLIIKAANQKYEDLKIDCNQTWSVLDLKTFLNQQYEFKPEVKGQRLIYSGHLLKDSQLVREVVNSDDQSPYIFHLVYWNNNQASSSASSPSTNSSQPPNPSSSASVSDNANTQPQQGSHSSSPSQPASSQGPGGAQDPADQRLQYYRAYNLMMSDYYRDMSQRYALAGLTGQTLIDEEAFFRSMVQRPAPGFIFSGPGNGARPATQVIFIRRRGSGDEEQGVRAQVRAVARNVERMFEGRDLVRDMFTFFKALFMSSMILLYSPSNRLLIVLVIGLLYFLNQYRRIQNRPENGNFYNNNNINNNGNNNGDVNDNAAAADNVNNNVNNGNPDGNGNANTGSEANGQAGAGSDNASNSSNNAGPEAQGPATVPNSDPVQQRQSTIRFIAEVVMSIFTSLIPEPPNVNQ